jgi:RNA polymerase primary sigma factor
VLDSFARLVEPGRPARESMAGIILQPHCIREITDTIRAASRRLVELEGRLLRLAHQVGLSREELAKQLQSPVPSADWLRRQAHCGAAWQRLLRAEDGEATAILEEIRTTIALAGATIAAFRKKARKLSVAEKGLEHAKNEMTIRNLRLVVWVARSYAGRGVPMADIIQEGNIGLMRAVEKFDYRRGHRFATYAAWWVRQGISRSFVDGRRTIRLPVHLAEAAKQLTRERHRLSRALARDPSEEELGQALRIPVDKVKLIVSSMRGIARLDAPVGEDGEARLGDFLVDDTASPMDIAIESDLRSTTETALAEHLTPREAEVVRRRFGIGQPADETLAQIGIDFRVTRERIRQIESKALMKLAHSRTSRRLRSFLEP